MTSCGMERRPSAYEIGSESRRRARPRSPTISTPRRGRRSTSAPIRSPKTRNGRKSARLIQAISIGPALRSWMATIGMARLLKLEPRWLIVSADQRRRKPGSWMRRRRFAAGGMRCSSQVVGWPEGIEPSSAAPQTTVLTIERWPPRQSPSYPVGRGVAQGRLGAGAAAQMRRP